MNELFHRLVDVLLRGDRDVRRVRVTGHPGLVDRDLGGALAEGGHLTGVVRVVCFVFTPDDETGRICPGSRG